MYVAKEKNRCSECKKKVLYAGPKSARNILTDLSPNPARARTETSPDLKSPAYNSTPKVSCCYAVQNKRRLPGIDSTYFYSNHYTKHVDQVEV